MAGHSKWANIQHRKGRQDVKRGKEFTKAAREIIIASKGGGDPASNARLRTAIAAAKSVNLPKDKIEGAIRKGTGQDAGGDITEITYEGYAPGGIAVIIETATDNKNRTVAEVRHIFSKYGGSMGESGAVIWMFDKLGVITLSKEKYVDEDEVMNIALEAGADDVQDGESIWEIHTAMEDFNLVRDNFEQSNITMESAELSFVAKNTIAVDAETGRKLIRFNDAIEDLDDVQNVYFNFELPDDFEE